MSELEELKQMLLREKELEIELQHTINTLKIMVDLALQQGFDKTVLHVRETIKSAEKVLKNES